MALVSGIGGSVAAGSSLQTAIVRLAQYRANTVRDTAGLCECSGGNGHCTGCDAIPVFQKRERQPGADGMDGRRGDTPIAPLFPGADGRPGVAAIHVTSKTGPEQTYRSHYQLELVGFDVEDENEDGINEPGEHIFIRRIRVKNTGRWLVSVDSHCLQTLGGMPSPARQPILEVIPSDYLLPVPSNAGRALIPTVLAGQTITLPGSIKVMIQEPDVPIMGGFAFKKTINVALKATMPGINRRLDHFDIEKAIDIQYPLELEYPDILRTVAQGSENKISMKINNKGSRGFGTATSSPRRAEIRISIPAETGSLRVSSGTWASQITAELGQIDPMADIKVVKTAKISHKAKDHTYSKIRIEFYISNPNLTPTTRQRSASTQRITQSFVLKIQVAATHIYDEDAGILVVTNEETPADQFEAIGHFIRKDLGLKMDVWNVSLYGGLTQHDQSPAAEDINPRSILNEYRGKTIIFLGNKFEHFGLKDQTIFELCESQIMATECFSGSSCLVLGSTASTAHRDKWLKTSVFPVSHRISEVSERVTESSKFNNKTQLVESICEQMTTAGTRPGAYQIECIPRWYFGGARMTVKRQAKEVRSYLRTKLPQERFLVCAVAPRVGRTETFPGYVAVWHGLPSKGIMFTTEPKPLQKERGQPPKLHPFDAFNVVCALPYTLRIRLLCNFDAESSQDATEEDEGSNSVLSHESAYPDTVLDTIQFSLEENISAEIRNYLRQGSFMNDIVLGADNDPCGDIRIHLPCLDTVLLQFEASDRVSERTLDVINTAMTATKPQSMGQVARSLTLPFGQRRAQLKSYLMKRVDALLREKGYSDDALKAFHSSVRTRHSSFDGKKRDVSRIVEERNRKFTRLSTHEYRKGRQTAQKVVPQTQLCTEADWDKQCQDVLHAHKKLEKNTRSAFERRAKMSTLRIGNTPDKRGTLGLT